MECINLKIKELKIEKLHDYIDYDINFNSDVTFLYGDNGCGKTTVLNIITSIITGKIYELFKFQFSSIALKYLSSQKLFRSIKLSKNEEKRTITINYNNTNHTIDIQKIRLSIDQIDEIHEVERFYFNEYPFLMDIRNEFSYIFLPLNRNGSINNEENKFFRRRLHRPNARPTFYSDISLSDVSMLVKDSYNRINFTLSKINENLSENLLKSFLDVDHIANAHQLLAYAYKLSPNEIKKIKADYTDVLKIIKKWDSTTEEKITEFFNSLLSDMDNQKNGNDWSIEILFKLSELIKITNIIAKAEEVEKSKDRTLEPLSNFLSAVNKFINTKTSQKEISIDSEGQIFLKTSYKNRIDLQELSSGEKQIVTFFAYLIFGLRDTNQSLFIVDEPELSLHLQWQRQFVDTILELNPDIQLIFATHAPEIIGKHIDKAVKLIPNY